jgi:N-acyl-D-amino-acid deacylase
MSRRLLILPASLFGLWLWSVALTLAADGPAVDRGRVIGVLEDFDKLPSGPFQKGFLDSWRWTDEVRARARDSSQLEIVDAPEGKGKLLRLRINDEKVLAGEALSLLRLAQFYPPEADAVRIRMRVTSGQAVIYVGGPTAYYGNSDVFTEPQTIRAADKPEWVEVVCNFNHPTWRNYRRAGFSTEAPRNYHNRWAQEPISVFVAAGTHGEFFINRIELVALGEGQPFAAFAPDQIRKTKTIADFETDQIDRTFSLYMADGESEWFEQSWKREKPLRFTPQQLSIIDGGLDGTRSLACTGSTAEEVHCIGIRTGGDAEANALAVKIAVAAPDQRNVLAGAGPTVPIDFLVLVAPPARPFPWQRFAPSDELRAFKGPGFDYQFSYRTIRNYADVDFAIYQTRRYLKPSEWATLVLPAADFTCVYGHGLYRRRLIDHEPLTCDDVVAVAWLNPWCRVGKRNAQVTTRIDELSFVHVQGSPAEQRSFWQVPDVKKLQHRESTSPRGRIQHIGLPGDLPPQEKASATADVVIRNGTVIDGTGGPGVQADVAITAGRIVAIGQLKAMQAKETIDARDRIVCPGFIDLHSHADQGILEFRPAENYIRQGVTTLVCGNCGSSPIDVAEFFRKLREGGTGPNVSLLIGHGSVRREVIGALNVAPNVEQLAQMKRLVRKAMQDGAVGMSTGLTYSPSSYGTTEEISELAKELAPFAGFYATHMRDEGTKVFEAIDEALKIGRDAGVPVHISHHKISAASAFGLTRLTLQRIDEARAAGMDVTLDQYPYGAGSGSLSFYVPQSSLSGGLDAYRRRIADPPQRTEIVAAVEDVFRRKLFEAGQQPDQEEHIAAALARVQVARVPQDSKLAGKNLAEILRERGSKVTIHNGADALVDLVGCGAVGINHTLDARPGGDVDRVMQHRLTAIASDGSVFEFGQDSPHPRSYGCFPRVLGHYVRERQVLKLENAIHKMTQLPARRLGWQDRGVIAAGQWADLVVFDPKTVIDKATFLDPHQHSVGIEHVLVRGQFVLKSGEMTGKLPGQPVPGKRSDSDEK